MTTFNAWPPTEKELKEYQIVDITKVEVLDLSIFFDDPADEDNKLHCQSH